MKALPKVLLALTGVAALSLAYPASVQAVPTTYKYTGNPFTAVSGPYTTSMFVTVMVTLAAPLPPNFEGLVNPTAYILSDGVQTLQTGGGFFIVTGPTGLITGWDATAGFGSREEDRVIASHNFPGHVGDFGDIRIGEDVSRGFNFGAPGEWRILRVADTGSTLSLMTLTLMALGLLARRFPAGSGLTAPASNSRNAVSFSSGRTVKRFPSWRCASAIQIVRPRA